MVRNSCLKSAISWIYLNASSGTRRSKLWKYFFLCIWKDILMVSSDANMRLNSTSSINSLPAVYMQSPLKKMNKNMHVLILFRRWATSIWFPLFFYNLIYFLATLAIFNFLLTLRGIKLSSHSCWDLNSSFCLSPSSPHLRHGPGKLLSSSHFSCIFLFHWDLWMVTLTEYLTLNILPATIIYYNSAPLLE